LKTEDKDVKIQSERQESRKRTLPFARTFHFFSLRFAGLFLTLHEHKKRRQERARLETTPQARFKTPPPTAAKTSLRGGGVTRNNTKKKGKKRIHKQQRKHQSKEKPEEGG
jgi:hypothetical protein